MGARLDESPPGKGWARSTSPPVRSPGSPTRPRGGSGGGEPEEVISVCVRVRGLSEQEVAAGDALAWRTAGNRLWEVEAEAEAEASGGAVWAFDFPAVLGPEATQEEAYAFVRPVVASWLGGVNGTVFAFGQTSAGKTHTMGGITPRALADLFSHLAAERRRSTSYAAAVSLSYLEARPQPFQTVVTTAVTPKTPGL